MACCLAVAVPYALALYEYADTKGSKEMDALLLIDFQEGFSDPFWGKRNNPHAEFCAKALLLGWRQIRGPVVHIRHRSMTPGSPLSGDGLMFKNEVAPEQGETVFEKSVNSAFIGTQLLEHLNEIEAKAVTICGLTTPHCVSTTARMAANLGFKVRLVADACAAFTSNADCSFDGGPAMTAEEIHRSALAHLHGEFATVCQTDQVLKAL